jgi:alpha-L-fucosidase
MAWWREAKFGMFIHWGVYAVPAGVHEGVRDAEWIMRRAEIPVERYRAYAREFNPVNYDPASWVKLAQEAGTWSSPRSITTALRYFRPRRAIGM